MTWSFLWFVSGCLSFPVISFKLSDTFNYMFGCVLAYLHEMWVVPRLPPQIRSVRALTVDFHV